MTKLKKFKPKTHKGLAKRVRFTGGSPLTGKLVINRIGDNHRNIGKSRERLLKSHKKTVLSNTYKKLRKLLGK
jgi:ribosomal protein L35